MRADETHPTPTVLIACPGLDHIGRGFETLARECFEALRSSTDLDVTLAKGSGPTGADELVARCLRRDHGPARVAGKLLRRTPYDAEQLSFCLSLIPRLRRLRPDLVYVSDWLTSRVLARFRARTRASYGLVVSNGGPWEPHVLDHADHVQELTPAALDQALAAGQPPERHTLLPLGVRMPASLASPSAEELVTLRGRLGLPPDRPVLLSVGALSRQEKRVDYLIEEVASLPEPRPFLVLLGSPDPDGAAIQALAQSSLGRSGFLIRAVASEEVADHYRAADVFVLASLAEAFGRVMVEAMSHGLPCVVHDGPVQRYLLGEHGRFADLRRRGELARALSSALRANGTAEEAAARHAYVHERFSWQTLAPAYASFLRRVSTMQN